MWPDLNHNSLVGASRGRRTVLWAAAYARPPRPVWRLFLLNCSRALLPCSIPPPSQHPSHRLQDCFDFSFYLRRNKDLVEPAKGLMEKAKLLNSSDEATIWEHFVYHGQFEPRRFR